LPAKNIGRAPPAGKSVAEPTLQNISAQMLMSDWLARNNEKAGGTGVPARLDYPHRLETYATRE
jgi:hypothetical protein